MKEHQEFQECFLNALNYKILSSKKKKMKDKKRIRRICKLLEKEWSKVPNQRLGQFLSNYVFGRDIDIFYAEDYLTEELLRMEKTKK